MKSSKALTKAEAESKAARGLKLAGQIPAALRELVRGIEDALGPDAIEAESRRELHRALITQLLRIIFVFYAEAYGVALPRPPTPLLQSLRARYAEAPDDLCKSAAAWALLVENFEHIRERYGPTSREHLFDLSHAWLEDAELNDAIVYRLLSQLSAVEGEQAAPSAYAGLPLEYFGSLYEAMMGFEIEELKGPSLVVSTRKTGALPVDVVVDIEEALSLSPTEREAYLEKLGLSLSIEQRRALEDAASARDLASTLAARRLAESARLFLKRTEARRRSGSHYTSRELAERVVEATLAPLFREMGESATPERILSLRVCDPAMGSGAFLLAGCRVLAKRLVEAWQKHGAPAEISADRSLRAHAKRRVVERCLYGVDKDPIAVELAKLSLWLVSRTEDTPFDFIDHALRHGDSLVEAPIGIASTAETPSFSWLREYPSVFDRDEGGFDAFVGNPPWVSYAGRAAQPLDPARRAYYATRFESFSRFCNLQGIFIERSAELLRKGGRLGFVLPSSMSEQGGYGPTRLAHDRLCKVDNELPDLGEDSFPGVVQPSMVLLSTRREREEPIERAKTWPVERPDLDSLAHSILDKMDRPPLPPALFGERGLQTTTSEAQNLQSEPSDRYHFALRGGSDLVAFQRREPSFYVDPDQFEGRLRSREEWAAVRLFIRQTARVPIASLADGLAFRNSILAGFDDVAYPAAFLVAYLNSSPIRWQHYMRHRDARQGIPQLKIGHLRAIPSPPSEALVRELAQLGETLCAKNAGLDEASQRAIDDMVSRAFDLSEEERERIALFAMRLSPAGNMKPPV